MDASERRRRAGEEAADWWVQLQARNVPYEVRERYVDWLRESPVHIAEALRIGRVHAALEQFQPWEVVDANGAQSPDVVQLPRYRRSVWRVSSAVSIIVLVCMAVLWVSSRGVVIRTERGERRELILADGSVVQLDPDSALRVRLGAHERRVVLERGRVLFRVAHDASRPFFVEADDTLVRAVGTAFGVERQSTRVVVTVVEGKVSVQSVGGAPAQNVATAPMLVANQQVTVGRSGARPVRNVDSRKELAWAEGRLIFEDDSVSRVIDAFNRYNRLQLRVTDAALAARPVSGVFSASDPESFVAFVQSVARVQVVRRDPLEITLAAPGPADR